MQHHTELVKAARAAIDEVFKDTSVPLETTANGLDFLACSARAYQCHVEETIAERKAIPDRDQPRDQP